MVAACLPGQMVAACLPGQMVAACLPGQMIAACLPGQMVAACLPGQMVAACLSLYMRRYADILFRRENGGGWCYGVRGGEGCENRAPFSAPHNYVVKNMKCI